MEVEVATPITMSLTLPRWFSSRKSLLNKSASSNNAATDDGAGAGAGAGDYRSLERGRKGANGGSSALALPPPPPPPPPPLMAPTYENVECGSFRVADRFGAGGASDPAPDTPAHRATTHEDILRARQTLKLRKSTSAGQVPQGNNARNSRREGHREFLNLASRAKSSASKKGPSGGLSHRSPSDALPSTPDEIHRLQQRSRLSAHVNSEGDDCYEGDDWGEGASILSELGVGGCGEDEAFWPSPPPPVPPPPRTRPKGLNLNFDVREEEEQPEDEYVLFEGAPVQESLAPKEENEEEEFRCWPSNGPSFTPPPLPEAAATTAPATAPATALSTEEPEGNGTSTIQREKRSEALFAHPKKSYFPFPPFSWC